MNWSRAKTILIALLLVVNVFLLVTYIARENGVRRDELEVRRQVCDILKAQGITVPQESVPLDSVTITPAVIRKSADDAKIAQSLFGEVSRSENGESVAYSGEGGNIMFSKNSFSLVYESEREIGSPEDARSLAKRIVSKLAFSADSRNFEVTEEDGGYKLTVPRVFSGVRVFNCAAEFKISSGGSVIAYGKHIGAGKLSLVKGNVINTSALMLSFADAMRERGKTPVTVHAIELGYMAELTAPGVVSLEPMLEISTDSGVFYINMQTGKTEAD
ncbi:MAG: hypothetical protein II996_03750 [Oscillospiraceae bacterium]|nr:hypothetical protein [Oscillospiraceae bacterium]